MKAQWNPIGPITQEIETRAMDRLETAAGLIAARARMLVPVGKPRKRYETGNFAEKPYTERVPGTLRNSIRVVRLHGDPKLNVRVYAGARQHDELTAYYAHMVERGTVKMPAKPYLRPALNEVKGRVKSIVESGYGE